MKTLLIFPPPASPVSPYLSIPLLCGQLENAGFDATCMDLSVEFFNHILSYDFLERAYYKAVSQIEVLSKTVKADLNMQMDEFNLLPKSDQINILRLNALLRIPSKEDFLNIGNNIKNDVLAYKDNDIFYDVKKIKKHSDNILRAFKLAMLPYFPAQCMFHSYNNKLFNLNYKDIKYQVEDINNNVFYEF